MSTEARDQEIWGPWAHSKPPAPPYVGTLIEQGIEAVVVLEANGTIIYANDMVTELTGLGVEALLGTHLADLLHPEDLERALANVTGVASGAQPRPALLRLILGDGNWKTFELNPRMFESCGLDGFHAPNTAVVIRDIPPRDAHWFYFAALASGEPFSFCVDVLARGLSTKANGPMAIAYDRLDGHRAATGTLPRLLTGVTADGRHDDTPGTPWELALRTGEAVCIDVADVPEPYRSAARQLGAASGLAVPVADTSPRLPALLVQWAPSRVMGEVVKESLRGRPIEAVSIGLERREATWRLERLAHCDSLTGLANRARFFEVLQQYHDAKVGFGVCYVDLDRFKVVNDTYGHQVGDEAIVMCARRMERVARAGDIVARFGGDEFAIACRGISSEVLDDIAQRLVDTLAHPWGHGDDLIALGASVGCALSEAGADPDTVVAAADAALYVAKRQGRGTWRHAGAPT